MMNTGNFNEKDIEIHDDGISVKGTYFSRKRIADVFTHAMFMKKLIKK